MVGQLRRTSEVFLVLQPVREVEVNGDTLPAKPWYELFPSQNSCQRAVFDMNTLYTDPIRGRITDRERESSRNAHGALQATVTAQHTKVATVSIYTDRPRQTDMDRSTRFDAWHAP